MAPFDRSHMSSYSPSIATMAISCIFCELQRLIGRKSRKFYTHLYLAPPQGVTPSEFREELDIHKTRMNGLSCGEESMTKCSAVLIQYQRVTDRRTDGQTDGRTDGRRDGRTDVQPIAITCFSIADARKNH